MALGFGKKTDKDGRGASSNARQVRGQRQKEHLPPYMRSPVLESLERDKAGRQSRRTGGRATPRARTMRYASEETLVRPSGARKSLPRSRSANSVGSMPSRTGMTAGCRLQVRQAPAQH